jgi:coproporphyrinogen III oxidase-like Fe-S oxidoreductase
MYALPKQTVDEAVSDVRAAIALQPAHISHYQLTLEPGTAFYYRPPVLPTDDESWDMQLACQRELAHAGFEQYEISAYARPARQCRHNLNSWQFGDYIGIGAGAHGKLTDAVTGQVTRTTRHRQPREYLRRSGAARVSERREVAADELPFEFTLNVLRLIAGFSIADFERRTGLDRRVLERSLGLAAARGLMLREGDRWAPTELGRQFLNDLQALFLPETHSPEDTQVREPAHKMPST